MPTIGYDPDFAPISFTAEDGEAEGRAINTLREAAERAGVECRFVPVELLKQDAFLEAGIVDVLAAMALTPERCERFNMSAPYLDTGAAWFALKSFDPELVPAGTSVVTPAAGPLNSVVSARWPHLNVLAATGYDDALKQVVEGGAMAATLNIDVGRFLCERDFSDQFMLPESPFFEVSLALACRKGRRGGQLDQLFGAIGFAD